MPWPRALVVRQDFDLAWETSEADSTNQNIAMLLEIAILYQI